jgi:hypothetical protein
MIDRGCLRKAACFFGDSQMRYAHNGYTFYVEKWQASDVNATEVRTKKEVFDSSVSKYAATAYGDGLQPSWASTCDVLFLNFGQWPLSHVPPKRWTAMEYIDALHKLLTVVASVQKQKPALKVFWVTTQVVTFMNRTCELHEHRTEPYVDLYNRLATSTAALYSIPVLDTNSMVMPVEQLTLDAAHFHWQGAVGYALAHFYTSAVCFA